MHFVVYLVQSGRISAEQGIAALDRQSRTREPLGRMALRARLMSVREVMDVLEHQSTCWPHRSFGELALERSKLDLEQLRGLLELQRKNETPLEEVLCELTGLSPEDLMAARRSFLEELRQAA